MNETDIRFHLRIIARIHNETDRPFVLHCNIKISIDNVYEGEWSQNFALNVPEDIWHDTNPGDELIYTFHQWKMLGQTHDAGVLAP
jgi:hypothetical protein